MLLGPLLGKNNVVFCPWDTDKTALSDSVPDLYNAVASKGEWRCIIICDEEGISKKNPYDLVEFQGVSKDFKGSEEERLEAVRHAKFAAFEQAKDKPLAKLAAHLCRFPLIDEGIRFPEVLLFSDAEAERLREAAQKEGSGIDVDDIPDNRIEDLGMNEYQLEIQKKIELYSQMHDKADDDILPPSEIICIAQRCEKPSTYNIRTSWSTHIIEQYSRFYDWNLYFDKMRYLVFDMLPKSHNNYLKDYVRFLCSVLIIANNEVPGSVLKANRVYRLDCETDDAALKKSVVLYDRKLQATDERLEKEIYKIEHEEKAHLSDEDAKSMFCHAVNIPVNVVNRFDTQTLYADGKGFGLAKDCPGNEENRWEALYRGSIKALSTYLKLPRRALKHSRNDFRLVNDVDTDRVKDLNAFQKEDVEEFISDSEIAMVSVETPDIYDSKRYEKELSEASSNVEKTIRKRMNKAGAIGLGAVSIIVFLLSFLPMVIQNRGGFGSVSLAVIITLVSFGLMVVAGLICLFVFRHRLISSIGEYNSVMHGVDLDIDEGMQKYSDYLTLACGVMRGYSVVNYDNEHEDNSTMMSRIRTKHRHDIAKLRAEFRDMYGEYLEEAADVKIEKVLFIGGDSAKVGAPYVKGASVDCKVEKQGLGKKIRVFKYKAKANERKTMGHRQPYTCLIVKAINA